MPFYRFDDFRFTEQLRHSAKGSLYTGEALDGASIKQLDKEEFDFIFSFQTHNFHKIPFP